MDNVKVSVIVPNYNYSQYLDARLGSILNQTFQDFELIILDDKSTDDSAEVIEKYRSHPKVSHIVYNEQNTRKPCKQWHKGFKLAVGEYIWIAEADDLAKPTFLETAVKCLDAEKDASIFFSGSWQNNRDGEFCVDGFSKHSEPRFRLRNGQKYYVFDGKFYLEHYLIYANTIYNASGTVFRRSAADESDWKYSCDCFSLGDWALWARLARKGRVIITKERLNCFRMHHNNATKHFSKDYRNFVDMLELTKDNIADLSRWKQMIVIKRLEVFNINRRLKKDRQDMMRNKMKEIYGEDFMRKARWARIINQALIITPWHICQSNDHRKRPDTMK